MSDKKTIYIAGPMRGYKDYNFPAFDAATVELEKQGWNVISPAQMDRDVGFDPSKGEVTPEFIREAMLRDVEAIIKHADAIAMLEGWRDSDGARAEWAIAIWKRIPVYERPSSYINGTRDMFRKDEK